MSEAEIGSMKQSLPKVEAAFYDTLRVKISALSGPPGISLKRQRRDTPPACPPARRAYDLPLAQPEASLSPRTLHGRKFDYFHFAGFRIFFLKRVVKCICACLKAVEQFSVLVFVICKYIVFVLQNEPFLREVNLLTIS